MQSSTEITKLKQGTIAWAAYPLTDKVDKLKRRPVLIISNSQSNELDNDYIVIPITKTIRRDVFSLVIGPEDVQGELPVISELRCNKPFTVRNALIYEVIGLLNTDKLEEAILWLSKSVSVYRQLSTATVKFD